MLKNGMFLQNRYEIISRIGSGGMADVYKARDRKLNRNVAVKVLRSEFRDDKTFLSKFRAEAQAAAGLAHTNIVNVYDVGEEGGTSFIVMELVEGITLKAYIAKKGKLSVREATSIALQVASGLEVAHNNGIIHRDVKPQNILISVDGKAKIADFGIARAATSDTLTVGAMGSVHYCAPEQSRGGYCDAKSDIYSMGITMFEMLTGRLPFDGETTVEVALKHLQENVPSLHQFLEDIPRSTERIVQKCLQKSPDQRYANMGELIRDLKQSLVNPGGDFVKIREIDSKAHTVTLSKEEVDQIRSGRMPFYDRSLDTGAAGGVGRGETPSEESRMFPGGGSYYQNSGYHDLRHTLDDTDRGYDPQRDSYQRKLDYPPDEDETTGKEYADETDRKKRKRKTDDNTNSERLITIVSVIAALVFVTLLVLFLLRGLGILGGGGSGSDSTEKQNQTQGSAAQIAVPDILGKSEAEAQKLLREQGLGYLYQGEMTSSQYEKGLIAAQSITSGTMVESNTTIGYSISSGFAESLTVPELAGKSQQEAELALRSLGLQVVVDNSRYSSTVAEGMVITTNPGAGSTVSAQEKVTIYISQGPDSATVRVPMLEGHYQEDAVTALNNLGLYVYITEEQNDFVEKGMVIAQDVPADSMVQTGTTVTITVSLGSGDEPDVEIVDPQKKWVCTVQLNAPEVYEEGEPVRIDLVQNGISTTVFQGYTDFPYLLTATGIPGVTSGTVYIYILEPSTGMVTSTTEYEGIVFSEVEE